MNLSRFIAFLALIGLSFISALLFEARMTKGFSVELVVIFIGVIFSIIAAVSLLEGESGGWFLATLIFGAALVNAIVLFLIVKSFALLILAIVVNITGMIFSVLSAADMDDEDYDTKDIGGLETYGDIEDEDDDIERVKPKRSYKKRKAKRKTTKKKSKRKKRR